MSRTSDRKNWRQSIDAKPPRLTRKLMAWADDSYAALRLAGFDAEDAARIIVEVFRERMKSGITRKG